MKLKGLVIPAAALTAAQRAEMFALMDRHYENVTPAAFAADLAEKDWVILLFDPQKESLCGFSTQRLLDIEVSGRPIKALFSGDTIVARDRWGDRALAHVWGRLALSLIDAWPTAELYWFLISKGYKTYRFLPLFFHEFYPRRDAATPDWARTVIDALGARKFPGAYDADAGVVRAGPGKDRLRPGVADLAPERLRDPHVRFFAERNPGHADGDELCCLAPLTRANFTTAAYRVIGPEPAAVGGDGMSLAGWLNTAWMLKCLPEAWAFRRATRDVAGTQARALAATVRRNADTEFGRAHRFARIRGPRDFQERVPLSLYEDYAPAVERIAAGAANVLTAERVELLEPTSGTTGGEKLIPCTAGLRRQFQRGVAAWIAELFRDRPAVRRGRAYWSISPALGPPRRSPGGIPIGFDADAAYLGRLEQFALERLLVMPPAVARVPDLGVFRYCTLLFLLAAADLALLSVWNPTFLTALLTPLDEWRERLCFDLRRGSVTPPGPLAADLAGALRRRLRPDPARAARLAEVLATPADRLCQIWPGLTLISCWADAAAGQYLHQLRRLFPATAIQPKGLLATEAFVSFPLGDDAGAALAVRSHFFEFEESDGAARGPCRLAQELDRGGRYRVVVTTAGGLYRYQLRDEVEVVGFCNQCPRLRFLGKSDLVSDLVGEKLAEPHVRALLNRLPAFRELRPEFALLVTVADRPARYRLYLQQPGVTADVLRQLRSELQQGLEENPYYRQAVALGQLASVEVALLDPAGESASRLYEQRCMAAGQKCGDIKPTALDRRPGWPEVFARLTLVDLS